LTFDKICAECKVLGSIWQLCLHHVILPHPCEAQGKSIAS